MDLPEIDIASLPGLDTATGLFGSFGAADIMFAPVVSRFITYGIGVPGFALTYMQAVWEHEWLQDWVEAAEAEEWVYRSDEANARLVKASAARFMASRPTSCSSSVLSPSAWKRLAISGTSRRTFGNCASH